MSWFSKLPLGGDPIALITFHRLEQVTWSPPSSKSREISSSTAEVGNSSVKGHRVNSLDSVLHGLGHSYSTLQLHEKAAIDKPGSGQFGPWGILLNLELQEGAVDIGR